MKEFTLTKQHLALLNRMWATWWDMEFGAPAVDPKRPYGNSDVLGDIAEIIGMDIPNRDDYEEFPAEVELKLLNLHLEMETALAIMLRCGTVKVGKYKEVDYDAKELCSGESKQYITDKYSKVIGKKYALLDALTVCSLGKKKLLFGTKAYRTTLWKKFHETFGAWE